MRSRVAIGAIVAVLGLAACVVTKDWASMGGSRADATVQLGFEYGMFEKPKADGAQALQIARQKCAAWGFKSAEAFGGVKYTCLASNANGCTRWRATAEFQCTGNPDR